MKPPRFGLGDISQVDSIPFSPSSLTLHFHPLQFVRRFLRVSVLHSAAPSSLRKQSSHGRIGYRGVAQSWSPVCHYRASTRVLKIELFRFPVQWNCRSRLLIDRNPLRLCQPLPIGTRLSPNWDFERLNRRDTRNQGPEDPSGQRTNHQRLPLKAQQLAVHDECARQGAQSSLLNM